MSAHQVYVAPSTRNVFNPSQSCLCSACLHSDFRPLPFWVSIIAYNVNRIVTPRIAFPLTLSSRHSTTALFSFISLFSLSALPLSWVSFPLLSASSLWHFSFLFLFFLFFNFFLCPDLSKFPSVPACCHCARGIWRDDQVKMMCFAASCFFFLFFSNPPRLHNAPSATV